MHGPIFMREIVGTIEDGEVEICASAEAIYNSEKQEVSVALDASARRVVAAGAGPLFPHSWLPPAELVKEHLPREEAVAFARDVFQSWAKKVRQAVPNDLRLHV